MKNQINTEFYSNRNGEIFAFVSENFGKRKYRIISNIETFKYSEDMLICEAESGFESFPYFDIWDYNGVDFSVVAEDIIFEKDLEYVGSVDQLVSFINPTKKAS